MENTNRKKEISTLNILLCMLVIFIHCSSVPVTSYDRASFQYMTVLTLWRLAAFAVQGFLFLSGIKLFLRRDKTRSYADFYRTRALKILLPYLVAVTVYYLYFCAVGWIKFSFTDLLFNMLTGEIAAHFYFIVILVQFYLLLPLWRFIVSKIKAIYALPAAAIIMIACEKHLAWFNYNDRIFTTYLFYFLLGCYAGANYEKFIFRLQKFLIPLALVFGVFAFADVKAIDFQTRVLPILSSYPPPYFYDAARIIHNCYCVFAFLLFLALFAKIKSENPMSKFTALLDKSSYEIYLLHVLVIVVTNSALSRLGVNSITLAYAVRLFAAYALSISLCMIYNKVKSKIKRRA